jgi:hypothetical protein
MNDVLRKDDDEDEPHDESETGDQRQSIEGAGDHVVLLCPMTLEV